MVVRWKGKTPQEGYESFNGLEWVPISKEEIDEASKSVVVTYDPEPWMLDQLKEKQ